MQIEIRKPESTTCLADLKPGDCFRGDVGNNSFNSNPKAVAMVVEDIITRQLTYVWLHGDKPCVASRTKYQEFKHRTIQYLGRLTLTP